jgi:hypothetical protein
MEKMPPGAHVFLGFGLVQSVIRIAVVIVFIWLAFKLGKLADAYSDKLKTKPQ